MIIKFTKSNHVIIFGDISLSSLPMTELDLSVNTDEDLALQTKWKQNVAFLRAMFSLKTWRLVGCLYTDEWLRGCQVTVEGIRRFGRRTETAEMRWNADWVAGIHRRLFGRVWCLCSWWRVGNRAPSAFDWGARKFAGRSDDPTAESSSIHATADKSRAAPAPEVWGAHFVGSTWEPVF